EAVTPATGTSAEDSDGPGTSPDTADLAATARPMDLDVSTVERAPAPRNLSGPDADDDMQITRITGDAPQVSADGRSNDPGLLDAVNRILTERLGPMGLQLKQDQVNYYHSQLPETWRLRIPFILKDRATGIANLAMGWPLGRLFGGAPPGPSRRRPAPAPNVV